MKKLFFILLGLCCSFTLSAHKIQSFVVNEDSIALEFVNIAVLHVADSVLETGCITDDKGHFCIECDDDNAIIRISMIGYETRYIHMPLPDKIQLSPSSVILKEVTIKASRKYVKATNNGLIVKMDNNPLSKLSSVADAIKQMPMINPIDGTVLGKGTPEIYINNRKVIDDSELKQLSPSKVLDVEIITRPGAKYDSNVKSVLIIHTKKLDQELAGVVTGTGTAAEVLSGNVNADLTYMFHNGIGLYCGTTFSNDGYKQKRTYTEIFNNNASKTLTQGDYRSRSKTIKANMGISYDFSSSNSIGLRYEFNRLPTSHYKAQTDIDILPAEGEGTAESLSEINSQSYQHSVNAYSDLKLGSKKNIELTTDADYVYGDNGNRSNTKESESMALRNMTTASHTAYYILAAKTNLNFKLKKLTTDVGAQYSFTRNKMDFDGSDNVGTSFLTSSNDLEKQHLYAGYVNLAYTLNDNWSLNGGLRFENAAFDYTENDKKIDAQSKTFTDRLPILGINFQKGNLNLGLTYNSNIDRPSYSELNNNYTYVSHTSWETGNPLLRSSLTHSLDLSVSWKQSIFEAIYSHNMRNINTVYTYLPSDNINVRKEINLPNFNSLTLIASQNLNVGFWHPMLQGLLYIQNFKYGSPVNSYNKLLGQVTMSNRFDLPWSMYAYISGAWTSKGNQVTLYSEGNCTLYFMLNKNMKNWSFNFLFNDFANTYRQKDIVNTNGVSYGENRKGASSFVQLSVTYTFKNKKSFKGKSAAVEEMKRF
ncbi:TonB-dependent receptor family protein [Xylanibacter oryzae]|uniref:TonB-dependent receptor family protein n=1 Tax=Xylanibacter oryzae TaxID=185293 RepID=UPI00146FBC5A|nr:TonB-dependent receptor family protein [Xylanibacter oryzae]